MTTITESEMAALGACLFGPVPREKVLDLVPDEAYLTVAHKTISRAIRSKEGSDIVTVCRTLSDWGALDNVGGDGYIITLMQSCPSPANAEAYARDVRNAWLRRKGAEQCGKLQRAFEDADIPIEETVALMEQIGRDPAWLTSPSLIRPQDLDLHTRPTGTITGIAWVDGWTGYGLPPGLVIVSAYQKAGKTSLMCQIGGSILKQGGNILYATFGDLSPQSIFRRMVRQDCGWDKPPYSVDELAAYDASIAGFSDIWAASVEFYWARKHGRAVEDLCRAVRARHEEARLSAVIADYAQLMSSRNAPEYKVGKVSELDKVGRDLKELGDDLQIPVLLGSQITPNKDGMDTTKYCRGLEEHADMVFRIKREVGATDATLSVPFGRHSDVGESTLQWDKTYLKFV